MPPYQRGVGGVGGEEVRGRRGCREKFNGAASNVRALHEGDVTQIQYREKLSLARPHIFRQVLVFLNLRATPLSPPTSSTGMEGPLHPPLTHQAIQIKGAKHTRPAVDGHIDTS